MIINKYTYKNFSFSNKKIKLPINIRQYEYLDEKSFDKLTKKQRDNHIYSIKYYGVEFRKKMIENITKKYNLTEIQLDFLSTYLLDTQKDANIISKYKSKQINRFEIPFSNFADESEIESHIGDSEVDIDTITNIKINYSEKQTKLYKLSQIPYIPNKSRWVTPNTNNVFEFDGISYIINKDNKNYKCDAQNTSKMDRVFCAYINDGIEFYDMNIDKIDAQLLQ